MRATGTALQIIPAELAFAQLQSVVHSRISDSYADHGGKLTLLSPDRQRFNCPEHGPVVPYPTRYRCPYCLPVGETEFSYSVTIGGQVVLNPS